MLNAERRTWTEKVFSVDRHQSLMRDIRIQHVFRKLTDKAFLHYKQIPLAGASEWPFGERYIYMVTYLSSFLDAAASG